MKITKLSIAFVALIFLFNACKKANLAGDEVTGEALNSFKLQTPTNFTTLSLNAATPAQVIDITWLPSTPGINTAPTYKWIAALKTGTLDSPILEIPSNNGGKDAKLSLTYQQIDIALGGKGVAAGATAELIWSVVAENGTTKIRSLDVFNIKLIRFAEGATPFILLAPLVSSTPLTLDPSSTSQSLGFKWTKSLPRPGGAAITYRVLFAERRDDALGNELPVNWASPLFSIAANNASLDTNASITYKRMSDSLSAKGFTNLSTPVRLKWTVVATSGSWHQQSDYTNEITILREVKVYVVGSATPGGWDIAQSTRMLEDNRFPGTFYTYIRLTGGNEIKFVNGQNWPPFPGAIDWGQDPSLPAGNITDNNESNLNIATTGIYRITFDLANKKYYLQTAVANGIGGMGMIGNFQGWSQPATKMNYVGVNKFLLLANMSTNNEFKFHDGNDWNNSANNLHRWFAVNPVNGKMVIDPGAGFDNFKWTGANGRMRSIWDGSDIVNPTYDLTPATEMRVVGDGITAGPVWSPGTSPTMTYAGNGVWTITMALLANKEIKFLSGNDWPSGTNRVLDYEDNSGQTNSIGVARSIRWDGNNNFKTPATAGTYTITLNEYAQTVIIN